MRLRFVIELLILAMACFAPWAFGAVEAWAQLVLYGGIALVTLLSLFSEDGSDRLNRLVSLPSLAMGGLVLLGLVQAMPMPNDVLARLSPSSAERFARLLPEAPEPLLGDPDPVVPLPAATLSRDPDSTVQRTAELAAAWLLLLAVLGLGGGRVVYRRFGLVMVVNATLLALFALIQSLSWNGHQFWYRPAPVGAWSVGGPFICHSHLAQSLNMGLGLALGFLMTGTWRDLVRGGGVRLWAVYAGAIIAVGIVTSHSRGGFLAMLGAGALLALLVRGGRSRFLGGLALILVLMGFFLATVGVGSPYLRRLETILDPTNSGYSSRLEIWSGAVEAWQDAPVWGTGMGSFAVSVGPYYQRDRGTFAARAENEYVDLLAEGGLLGLGLGLVFLGEVFRLAFRALALAPSKADRGLICGGLFGVFALALHSLSDFGPHVPGVGVPAMILAAHLCRLGMLTNAAPAPAVPEPAEPTSTARLVRRAGGTVAGLALTALGGLLVLNAMRNVEVERELFAVNLLTPGAQRAADIPDASPEELERMRVGLESALRLRPDWSEGHLRLGLTHLALYEHMVRDWILVETGEALKLVAADPLWLLGVVGEARDEGDEALAGLALELAEQEPIRQHLIPAARSFLEARRCTPVEPLAHAKLASLSFLFVDGSSAAPHLVRALEQARNDAGILGFTAYVAALVDEEELATLGWHQRLIVSQSGWERVADMASAILPPERILEEIVPNGYLALQFGRRLYSDEDDPATYQRFLRKAAERLPYDQKLPPADRLRFEALAWVDLGETEKARLRMEGALALDPLQSSWRGELIDWLIRWGMFEEARHHAIVGLHYTPEDPRAQQSLEDTAEAMARGEIHHGS